MTWNETELWTVVTGNWTELWTVVTGNGTELSIVVTGDWDGIVDCCDWGLGRNCGLL